jgi:hypothetical protein
MIMFMSKLTHYEIIISLQPSGYYTCHQFNTHKFYVLPTQLYLCVLCGSEDKQRLFRYTALTDWFYNRDGVFTARYGQNVNSRGPAH